MDEILRLLMLSPGLAGPAGPAIGPWTAGVNTTLSQEAGGTRARATINAGANPRISRQVTNLEVGATYRLNTNTYHGTETGNILTRVSSTQNLTAGDYGELITTGAVQIDFVAPVGGMVYIGLVCITSGVGQFAETDWTFSLVKL